jgi:TonB family protein
MKNGSLLSPSSGINVFMVLAVVLQILTAQSAAAPSIGSSANTAEEKRTVVKPPPTVSLARPVEITSRPEPIYTDEARASKTEGTVILQVTFYRDGRVIIEHIVQKLPNGLTNAAVKAARGIRFHPAIDSDGQASDFTTQVRVKFLLAEQQMAGLNKVSVGVLRNGRCVLTDESVRPTNLLYR